MVGSHLRSSSADTWQAVNSLRDGCRPSRPPVDSFGQPRPFDQAERRSDPTIPTRIRDPPSAPSPPPLFLAEAQTETMLDFRAAAGLLAAEHVALAESRPGASRSSLPTIFPAFHAYIEKR